MKILSPQTIRKNLRIYHNIDILPETIHRLATELHYSRHLIGGKRGYESSLYTMLTRDIPSLVAKDKELRRQKAERKEKRNQPPHIDNYAGFNREQDKADYDWEKNESLIRRSIMEAIDEMELYHGSQAAFDKFDLAFLSSGWGQQEYGYGIYLSDSKQCALEYSKKGYVYICNVPEGKYLRDTSISRAEARRIAIKFFKYYTTVDDYGKEAYKGNEQIFWDEECKYVAECISGDDIYGTISSLLGSDKDTSNFLHSIGYKGLKLRSSDGSTGKKFKIYVIFDPNDIEIIEKKKYNEI